MKQIKTVMKPLEKVEVFDLEVNAMLAEGWMLKRREVKKISGEISEAFSAPAFFVLYAEMEREKPVPFEEITL